jgi:phosphoglycerol transferase MdoB-like AlkP superfamily enzyme
MSCLRFSCNFLNMTHIFWERAILNSSIFDLSERNIYHSLENSGKKLKINDHYKQNKWNFIFPPGMVYLVFIIIFLSFFCKLKFDLSLLLEYLNITFSIVEKELDIFLICIKLIKIDLQIAYWDQWSNIWNQRLHFLMIFVGFHQVILPRHSL